MKFKNVSLALSIWFVIPLALVAQDDTAAKAAIQKFQDDLNEEYKNPKTSPLEGKALKKFKGHEFFPVDLSYRVEAQLIVTQAEPFFKLMTSNNQPRDYRQYALVNFTLKGKEYSIPVYQSQGLMAKAEYTDYLFFPFTDLTNGVSTYAGGRYMDLRIPANSTVITLDFNTAYNAFCAYSDQYSCPVVPAKNNLDIEIPVGVKYKGDH
jgi:uncharacterized protein (DUF1684 family)